MRISRDVRTIVGHNVSPEAKKASSGQRDLKKGRSPQGGGIGNCQTGTDSGYNTFMTITIEHISDSVSKALEERALREGKSVPDVAAEILTTSLMSKGPNGGATHDVIAGSDLAEIQRPLRERLRWMDAGDLANRA